MEYKRIAIVYFSGTGNSKIVAKEVSTQFINRGVKTQLISAEELIKSPESLNCDFDLFALSYPIYGFGTPSIIKKVIKALPNKSNCNLIIFKTAADNKKINGSASTKIIRILRRKGYVIKYNRIIIMPPNWIVEYNNSLVRQIFDIYKVKCRNLCEEVMAGKERLDKPAIGIRIVASLTHFFESNFGRRGFGFSLYANKNCNNCGLCVKKCPNGNIRSKNKKVKFGINCLWCMRCVYQCPASAIKSFGMSFCILKNGYNLIQNVEDGRKNDDYITEHTEGFFKNFYQYLNDPSI